MAILYGDSQFFLIELEISTSVVVRDVFNHLAQQLTIVGQQALLYIVTQHIAEDTTEILVTWIAEERAAVGKHTYEATQQAQNREGVHLALHTVLLVVEPPTGTKLDLAWLTTLEVTQHRSNNLVGTWIQSI